MWRLAFVIPLLLLSVAPTALSSSTGPSFAFTTFDAPFFGAVNTEGNGINIFGTVVGDYSDALGNNEHGFKRTPNGVFTPIDVPGGNGTFAHDINNSGVIVGRYFSAGKHCFVLDTTGYRTIDVPFPGAIGTDCRGINDQGQIVGSYDTLSPTGQRIRHGFLLSAGIFTSIDVPFAGVTRTVTRRINNAGQIVGRYVLNGVDHGFLLDGGGFTSIEFPPARPTGVGGINDNGLIVGTYFDPSGFIFGFTRTVDTSQNNQGSPAVFTQIVLPGPGQNVGGVTTGDVLDFSSFVAGVNDMGQITGTYMGSDGHVHGFVTAPKHAFEVTGSAPVGVDQNIISGVFEGDPVGEGTFTITGTNSPAAGIPWGLFVFCGRIQPTAVLTSSTGDQVFLELLFTVCQTAFPPMPFSGVLSGFYRIIGGTGRFGGASGSGFITGTATVPTPPTPGTVTFTLVGTISRF
jgi:hypothetical protein